MDKSIIGFWKVIEIDMISDRTVTLIPGLIGETIQLSKNGRYYSYPHNGEYSKFRTFKKGEINHLDVWIDKRNEFTTKCIYSILNKELVICIAGDYGKTPTEMKRDDSQLWVLKKLIKTEKPKNLGPEKTGWELTFGKFIPKGFLD